MGVHKLYTIKIMKLLERYIFRELFKAYLLTFSIFTLLVFVVAAMRLVKDYSQYLNFLDIIAMSPYILLSSMALTMPLSLLPAVTLTYGRMAYDREILILRSSGIHAKRMFSPAVSLSLLCAFVCLFFNTQIVPGVVAKQKALAYRALDLIITATFSTEQTTIDFIPQWRVYYDKLKDAKLHHLVIQKIEKESFEVTQEILAKEATLAYDKITYKAPNGTETYAPTLVFRLKKGSITHIKRNKNGQLKEEKFFFGHIDLPIPMKHGRLYNDDRDKYRPFFRLVTVTQQRKDTKEIVKIDLNRVKASLRKNKGNIPLQNRKNGLEKEYKFWHLEHLHGEVEIYRRLAMSFSPIIMVLWGAPLGILVRHSNKLVAFGISSIPILLIYYPIMIFGKQIGEAGTLPPFLATWLCNIVAGTIGVGLMVYVFKK